MAILKFTFKVAGVLTDATSVVLSDPSGTYGIQRTDTSATVIAADTVMNRTATGTYTYDFSSVINALEYRFYVKCVYNGETHYFETVYTATEEASVVAEGRIVTARFTFKVAGVLTDATSVVLSDPSGTYGIRKVRTGEIVVAANTEMTKTLTGIYEHDFTVDANNIQYQFYVKCVYNGEAHYFETLYKATGGLPIVYIGRTMPSEVIWKYLVDTAALFMGLEDGGDWPLCIGHLPDGNDVPVECAAIYNTTGLFDGKDMRANIDQHFGIQIALRALTEAAGYGKMADVENTFKNIHNERVTYAIGEIWRINCIVQTSPVVSLGVDDQRRFIFTCNFLVSMVLT